VTEQGKRLLIVEDDPGLQSQLRWCFEDYEAVVAEDRETALAQLRRYEPPVVLQDLGLPPDPEGVGEGLATLEEIMALAPETKVIVVTGHGDQENAIKAVGLGAYDFYEKPVDTETLQLIVDRAYQIHALERENVRLLRQDSTSPLDGIIAASEKMLEVCRMVEKVAPTNATTLLTGESGTGKELLARALHSLSTRVDKPLVAINCAAIPESLLESELFGHERGAFTRGNQADSRQSRNGGWRYPVSRRSRGYAVGLTGQVAEVSAGAGYRTRWRARRNFGGCACGMRNQSKSRGSHKGETFSARPLLSHQ